MFLKKCMYVSISIGNIPSFTKLLYKNQHTNSVTDALISAKSTSKNSNTFATEHSLFSSRFAIFP